MRKSLVLFSLLLTFVATDAVAENHRFWCTDLPNHVNLCELSQQSCTNIAQAFSGSACVMQETAACYTYSTLRDRTVTKNVSCHRTLDICMVFRSRTFIPAEGTVYTDISQCIMVD